VPKGTETKVSIELSVTFPSGTNPNAQEHNISFLLRL